MTHTSRFVAAGFVLAVIALSLLVPNAARAGGRGKRVIRAVQHRKPAPTVPVADLAEVGGGRTYINSSELI